VPGDTHFTVFITLVSSVVSELCGEKKKCVKTLTTEKNKYMLNVSPSSVKKNVVIKEKY
jgi:hypothetical protein